MSIKALGDYTYISKYARYNKEEKRRETWGEAVDRVKQMHLRKYPKVKEEIEWAFEQVLNKRVLCSMRSLQFGGEPIEKINERMYNCAFSYCDRPRFFQEAFFLLLSGSGVGFSVQRHHVAKLPRFTKVAYERTLNVSDRSFRRFIIPDSIEGWSDALGVLLSSYLESPEFPEFASCEVIFDYSRIREKGSILSSGVGKAPGPEPLKRALDNIKKLLESCAKFLPALRPIDAYDIVMHSSDAVLSGGVRRSSAIALFSPDDDLMSKAKTGNWYYEHPQRARSNNSAVLLRDGTSFEQFQKLMECVKEFGEPGFIWADDLETGFNPCVVGDTIVPTSYGLQKAENLTDEFDALVEGTPRHTDGFWKTGHKDVVKIVFSSGRELRLTPDHKVLTTAGWKEAAHLSRDDEVVINNHRNFEPKIDIESQEYKDGYAAGDCMYASNNTGTWSYLAGLISGRFDYGGLVYTSVIEGSSLKIYNQSLNYLHTLQTILNAFGIYSKVYKRLDVHELVISNDNISRFYKLIPIKDENKKKKIEKIVSECGNLPNRTHFVDFVKEVTKDGTADVYDCTVPEVSAFDANGVYVHNCVEISLYAYDLLGRSGWEKCNLTEINGKLIKSEEDWAIAAKAAAIIGTLQAGYTDFYYIGEVSKYITDREALLGVSMTGMMENPDIIFNPELQRKMAELVKSVNFDFANKIGINPSARCTCVKPSGTTSCVLGTSSGIHPHHSKLYFRRVQGNKMEAPLQYFAKHNPLAIEESVWSANKTDVVITFCVTTSDGVKVKKELSAVDLLEHVKLTQQNWVEAGTRYEACVKPWLRHNVSNTIQVKENEWEEVTKFIYDNRKFFAGISLLPSTGDLDYPQAPFCLISTPEEIVKKYGDGSVFASGLIVDGLRAFDNNLWKACDAVLSRGIPENWNQEMKDWVRRANQFAHRYFNNDIKRMLHCLKEVNNWKMWQDLNREWCEVDYTKLNEATDETKPLDEIACAGGACIL
jgi:intein/homing endonuclease